MADIIDDAQAYNETYQAAALATQRAKVLPESHEDFDGEHCLDCGDEMPLQRLAWGRIRCVSCQEFKERVETVQRRNTWQGGDDEL